MNERDTKTQANEAPAGERAFAYRILRYTPNLVRDEWVKHRRLAFCSGNRRAAAAADRRAG